MAILTLNAGSSSLKFAVFARDGRGLALPAPRQTDDSDHRHRRSLLLSGV